MGVNRVIKTNRNKMQKIKIDNAQLFFNEISLSTKLSPRLEFTNSRINYLVLIRIHNPTVHILLIPIPKLTPQLTLVELTLQLQNTLTRVHLL